MFWIITYILCAIFILVFVYTAGEMNDDNYNDR